jgi:hypothetical protein
VRIETREALVDQLRGFDSLLEVGIGTRPDVAAALAETGADVTATDVHDRETPDGVTFRRDDVVARSERDDPGPSYRVDAVYALNLPPELHRPTRAVADAVDAACYFTTLGGDQPAVSVRRVTLPGETLYVARDR